MGMEGGAPSPRGAHATGSMGRVEAAPPRRRSSESASGFLTLSSRNPGCERLRIAATATSGRPAEGSSSAITQQPGRQAAAAARREAEARLAMATECERRRRAMSSREARRSCLRMCGSSACTPSCARRKGKERPRRSERSRRRVPEVTSLRRKERSDCSSESTGAETRKSCLPVIDRETTRAQSKLSARPRNCANCAPHCGVSAYSASYAP
mmetsp:Transcript_37618/g.93512  ORF Transcript_37618/g.93512 Transcript_37618/m.93512 type:complete len:212 (-) Transcript_37618:127-762(-)